MDKIEKYYYFNGTNEAKKEFDRLCGSYKIKYCAGLCYFEKDGVVYRFKLCQCKESDRRITAFDKAEIGDHVETFIDFLHTKGRFCNFTLQDVIGISRKRALSDLRQICYYFLRKCGFEFIDIGIFVNRDRTTVFQTFTSFMGVVEVQHLIKLTDEYFRDTYGMG
jgi:hypothetical protein